MADLSGKTALVTGGAKKLGAALTRALSAQGMKVILHYRTSEDEASSLAAEIEAQGGNCVPVFFDFSKTSGCSGFMESIIRDHGPLDVLVNSASWYPEDTIHTLSEERLLEVYRINLIAPVMLSRVFAGQCRRGHIVNLLDARMTDYDRNHLSYHLSKRSLHDMTRIMSIEFAPLIQVNAVAPGMVLFPEDRVGNLAGKALKAGLLDTLPSPEDIVHSVLYLLSSPALTGQVIFPDSGRNLRGSVYG